MSLIAFQIRDSVIASDADAVRELVRSTGFFSNEEIDVSGDLVAEQLESVRLGGLTGSFPYEFFFAEVELGVPVGYTCTQRIPLTEGSYDLMWIVVGAGHQGRGLGQRLLAIAEDRARAANGRLIYAETAGRQQYAPTREFYVRAGYRIVAQIPDFYSEGDDKIIFEKRLAPQSNFGGFSA